MAGYGLMPAGFGPFGLGTPAEANAPPTGAAGSRYINPATRDYQQDPDTLQLAQMPRVRQRVLLALTTLIKSSTTLPDFGLRIPPKIGTTFTDEMRAAVRLALRQLTEVERVVRIDSITVDKAGGRGRATVAYTDMTTGQPDRITI